MAEYAEKSADPGEWEEDDLVYEFDGWSVEKFEAQRCRAHFLLAAPYRYVSVILLPPSQHRSIGEELPGGRRLVCLDSPCYHASGPLGEGDLVELEDLHRSPATTATTGPSRGLLQDGAGPASTHRGGSILCIRCPWHRWLVSLETGEEVLLYPAQEDHAAHDYVSNASTLPATHLLRTITPGGAGDRATSRASPPVSFQDGQAAHVKVGKKVQRLHRAMLDVETGVLTIVVKDPAAAQARGEKARRSDGPATSLKNGGLCMQIQDIKAKGLDL